MRQPFWQVVKAFCAPQIFLSFTAASAYILISVFILFCGGIWQWENVKTTLLWGITFAFVTMFEVNRITEHNTHFRKTLRDLFNGMVIVTFIGELYSFSLLVEMILLPVLTLVGTAYALSETKKEWQFAKIPLGWILSIVGLSILIYSGHQVMTNLDGVATMDTAREFSLPIILSLMFLPFIYLLSTYITYQTIFKRIGFSIKEPSLLRYAKWKAILNFRTDLDFLRRWARHIGINEFDNRASIKKSIWHINAIKRREKNPLVISEKDGWSPYAAKDFLAEAGLPANDYHLFYDCWFANSNYKKMGDDLIQQDNLTYFIEGNENAVTRLNLQLNVNNPNTKTDSKEQFLIIARILLIKALGKAGGDLSLAVGMQETIGNTNVNLTRQNWDGSLKGGHHLTLALTRGS